jgi:hypothetical protein
MGLYSQVTKVKGPSYRIGTQQYTSSSKQVYQIEILYTIFKKHDIRKTFKDLYKRSIYKT